MAVKSKKKTFITIIVVIIAAAVILPLLLSVVVYQLNFGKRYETAAWVAREVGEFDGLIRERYSFKSDKGQELIGYKYFKETDNYKGVVIITHGLGGGGHNTYMDVADYFADNGYIVFGYDATGNDESGGNSVRGFPQGMIDLDYAIRFVKDSGEFAGLPIMLFGHSWGAYSAGSVLNVQPDVKAVVMAAGVNKSSDVIEEQGENMMGGAIKIFMPYINLIEKVKFGKASSYTCTGGFENSEAGVMIIHCKDDEAVSFERNYMKFYGEYKDNPRFVFIDYKGRGHDCVYYSDACKEHRDEYNRQFEEYVNSGGFEVNEELKTNYMLEHGDKSALFEPDPELFERIVAFYDSYT